MPLKKLTRFIIPSVLLGLLSWKALSAWPEISPYLNNFNYFLLFLSFSSLLLIYPESGWSWYLLLRRMGVEISLSRALYVWVVSNTGRYIPGTVWQYLGRIELGKQRGIPRREGIFSVIVEFFFVTIAGFLVSLFTAGYWGFMDIRLEWGFLLVLLLVFLLHPAIMTRLLQLIARLSKKNLENYSFRLRIRDSLFLLPWFIINFLLNGMALFLLVSSLGIDLGPDKLFIFSGFYALSWIVGYFSLFAPGGIGVTETILALLLSSLIPFSLASAVALIYRFLLILAELLFLAFTLRFSNR